MPQKELRRSFTTPLPVEIKRLIEQAAAKLGSSESTIVAQCIELQLAAATASDPKPTKPLKRTPATRELFACWQLPAELVAIIKGAAGAYAKRFPTDGKTQRQVDIICLCVQLQSKHAVAHILEQRRRLADPANADRLAMSLPESILA